MQNSIPDTKTHILSLENEEYELKMSLSESFIEFKLAQKKVVSDFYYEEKFDLSTINEHLFSKFEDLKTAYENYDKALNFKKVKLVKSNENTIYLNLKITVNIFEEKDANLELKQHKLDKNDGFTILLKMEKKADEMNEKIEFLFKDYLKRKQEEEEKKKKLEEEIKLQEKVEERLKLNDNVNYLNDFKCENIDKMDYFNYASIGPLKLQMKSVAIYPIIRNNEIILELACISGFNDSRRDITLYNVLLNKKTNTIYNAHLESSINSIKHYYYPYSKKHFLLSSSNQGIKLWNITSDLITNELKIIFKNSYTLASCLLFVNDNYFIVSDGYNKEKPKIFNKDGSQTQTIENSSIDYAYYIEAAYVKDKPYVLLSGNYHLESYDYKNYTLQTYKSKDNQNNQYSYCINLFKKNEKEIYLMSGQADGKVIIFDFLTAIEQQSIKLSKTTIYGLCSLSEKYFLVSDEKEMKVIEFDSKSPIRNYKNLVGNLDQGSDDDNIRGIEKVKIPEKGEFIISYSERMITLWK